MSLVDQHQIIAFKSFYCDRLIAHFIAQLIDVDDFDCAFENTAAIFIEQAAETKARKLQFVQMLARQPFIRRKQNDLIRVNVFLTALKIM